MKDIVKKAWKFLEGNKRRIALLGAFVAQITPVHTLAYQIGQGVFLIFASADMLNYSISKFKNTKGIKND